MGLELDDFKVPSKSKLFCDSMILIYYSDVLKKHYHVENSVSKKKKKNQCANPNFILLCVVKKKTEKSSAAISRFLLKYTCFLPAFKLKLYLI